MTLSNQLGMTCPIVQAPMAGGATTPELIAAVSNAGGLGSLGAGMTAPKLLTEQIDSTKALTDRAFAVNLMVLSEAEWTTLDAPIPEWLTAYYTDNALEIALPNQPAQSFADQFQVLLDNPVSVASFTFGIISREQVDALHKVGTKVIGTANHPLEAQAWAEIDADAVCVQGVEAGGHRGGWLALSEADPLGLLTLIDQTKRMTDIPLIAAGGIMTATTITAAQIAGAEMVQMGTAFLTTHESGISQAYKDTLLNVANGERAATTRLTRLFSGKPARALDNDYLCAYQAFDNQDTLPPYPQLNAMTRTMRATAGKQGDVEHLSMWAGQGVSLVRSESVAELMARLTSELAD